MLSTTRKTPSSLFDAPDEQSAKRRDGIRLLSSLRDRVLTDEKLSREEIARALSDAMAACEAEMKISSRSASKSKKTTDEFKNFAYSVSHDLRAPLVNLSGFIVAMEDESKNGGDLKPYIDRIKNNLTRFKIIIDGLLLMSRTGSRELLISIIDPASVFNSVISDFQAEINSSDAIIVIENMPEIIEADIEFFTRIVSNIVSNAFKYRDSAREFRLQVCYDSRDGQHVFSVTDNGRGIETESPEDLFHMFRREKNDTQGDGIGLALTKKMIEMHGGEINISNNKSHGCTVTFSIPISLKT